jgi:hypothetical protein
MESKRWVESLSPWVRKGPNAPSPTLTVGLWRTGCGSGSLFDTVHSDMRIVKCCLWLGIIFADVNTPQTRGDDESFVLDKLTSLNGAPEKTSQFSGRLDLTHVAAVGHSRGGWGSILTCRRDSRVKACVNEDGTSNGEGLQYPGAATPKQPILYVEVPPVVPADWVVLKELQLTPDEWVRLWHETAYNEFSTFPAGGYFVELKLPGMVHYSFADEVLLQIAKEGQKKERKRLFVFASDGRGNEGFLR